MYEAEIQRAADAIRSAKALVIGSGAGMSVDAGIPAYRLNPPGNDDPSRGLLGALNPMLFTTAPELAWGRAGSQLALFRRTRPHRGYEILLEWSRRAALGAFVISSNVDGMFLAAGFPEDRVLEGHGSLHFMQCTKPCPSGVWSARDYAPSIDPTTECAQAPLPVCPVCGDKARPNVFMFGDQYCNPARAAQQARSLEPWLSTVRGERVVVIECGAGTAVPTIRRKCEAYARELDAAHIRINPVESQAEGGTIRLSLAALDALERIDFLVARG